MIGYKEQMWYEKIFSRIINVPKRGIGDTSVDKLENEANISHTSMYKALSSKKELEFKELIEDLINDYLKYLKLKHKIYNLIPAGKFL